MIAGESTSSPTQPNSMTTIFKSTRISDFMCRSGEGVSLYYCDPKDFQCNVIKLAYNSLHSKDVSNEITDAFIMLIDLFQQFSTCVNMHFSRGRKRVEAGGESQRKGRNVGRFINDC